MMTPTEDKCSPESSDQLDLISIIKRQTNYDEDTIKEKLIKFDNDIEKILYEFHDVDPDEKKRAKMNSLSNNQKIFRSIGDFFN